MDTWSDINKEAKQNHIELWALTETQIYKNVELLLTLAEKYDLDIGT